MNDGDKESLLLRHIGDHLKALALFSLPSLSTDPANDEQKSSSGAQLPTNDDSKADPSVNNQIVTQVDEDLEGSLNFNDDPHSFMDATGSKTIINEEHATNVPSDLDTNLEWKFASSEHEALEHDPVLQNLRKHGENQQMNSSEESHRQTDLYMQIINSFILSVFDDPTSYFLPNGAIDSLVTKDSVHRELWAEPSSLAQDKAEVESLVEFVLASAKRLFATAIMLGHSHQFLQKWMQWFQDQDITDDSLPLQVSWWEENCWHETLEERIPPVDATYNDSRSSSINKDLWPLSVVENFCFKQQWFLVPIFSDTGLSYDLEPGTILPFTERDPGVEDGGVEGITQYRIHERHMDQPTMDADRPYYVAVRQVRLNAHYENTTLGWKTETNTLRSLNSLGHEHIVRFLSAFRIGQEDDGHFMFEWANGGNLPNLWYTFHRPELTSGLVKAAFRQMGGLADAIDSVYFTVGPLYPRHGDLKPENIFWFKSHDENEFGTLKIFGWGFEDQVQYGEAKRYEAPELHTANGPAGVRSHLSDIWSMGCIMFECLIWLMYGVDMLERFSHASKSWVLSQGTFFYEDDMDGPPIVTLDAVVSEWMDRMEDDPACEVGTTALGNLLELIRTRLLVVKLPREPGLDWNSHVGLSHQKGERCTSGELKERMRKILENETEEYWLAAQPKSPPTI
ncbi:hypothetical protein BHE90_009124 [Fusarium euwallaceae]|uniref:Protein kinase domain-containing protein n=1 Tax=Fusarium euwallaceae TaxID=1147111 RepID=A0A430LKZ3_9HYPO|nr:hypothetical protein BHE90_009124 [Fusarium euwallaceae]